MKIRIRIVVGHIIGSDSEERRMQTPKKISNRSRGLIELASEPRVYLSV